MSIRPVPLPQDQDFLESTPLVTIMPDNDIVPRIDLQLGANPLEGTAE